jgi:2-amino-4-hydroxy-6-hydroxymethyldihydropteridine diphosphokinase
MTGRRIVRAYIGLGANLGDATATLARAVRGLEGIPGVAVRGVSQLYATAPWGVTDQAEFRNAVVAVDVGRREPEVGSAALALLGHLKSLERAAGRGVGPRWGPRELDLDLLLYGRHRISIERTPEARSIEADVDPAKRAKRLEVPHRDLGERLFVLAPLTDLAPRLVPPGWSESVETRRRHVAAAEPPGSVRVVGTWDPARGGWRAVRPDPAASQGAGWAAPRDRTRR